MKKQLFLLSSLCLMLTACESSTTTHTTTTTTPTNAPVDNTGHNVRDRGPTLTADNQPENEADRTITQKIRQSIMDESNFSTYAKNVKIITHDGVVTLRGPVNNEQEKMEIARRAKAISGVKSVDNQIEVVANGNGRQLPQVQQTAPVQNIQR